jgi:hypothetical protein
MVDIVLDMIWLTLPALHRPRHEDAEHPKDQRSDLTGIVVNLYPLV